MTRRPSPARQGPGPVPEPTLRRLGLTLRRRVAGRLPGDRQTAGSAADGLELSQLRPYVEGDDPRRLDPSASARTGEPHVRTLIPERVVTTWVVADVSPSMAFGSHTRLKSDVAEGVVDVVTRLGLRQGGAVSLTLAAGAGSRVRPPQGGRHALGDVRHQLRAGVLEDGTAPDLAGALDRVGRLARQAGTVVVVSDFREEGWEPALRRLAARHSTLAVEVVDPLEQRLPDLGALVLVDPVTGVLVDVDTSDPGVRELLAEAERGRRERVRSTLRAAGAQHVVLGTDEDWLRALGRVLR